MKSAKKNTARLAKLASMRSGNLSGSERSMPKRLYNRQLVRALLHRDGPASRLELGRKTGLPLSALTTLCSQLIREGFLEEQSVSVQAQAGRGRPRVRLQLAYGKLGTVCLAHSPEVIRAAVVDLGGGVRWERAFPCHRGLSPKDRLGLLCGAASTAIAESPLPRTKLLGIGVAEPGLVDRESGTALRAVGLPGWERIPLREALNQACHTPVLIERYDGLQALGEAAFGAGRGARSLLFVSLVEDGVGGGVVEGGRLVAGRNGGAGEIGHTNLSPDGPRCACGLSGCLEAYVKPKEILKRLRAHGLRVADFAAALAAFRAGDTHAKAEFAEAAHLLARAVGSAVNLLNPDRVVLGGYLADAGEGMRQLVEEHLPQFTLPEWKDGLKLCMAEHGERNVYLGIVCSFREMLCALPSLPQLQGI